MHRVLHPGQRQTDKTDGRTGDGLVEGGQLLQQGRHHLAQLQRVEVALQQAEQLRARTRMEMGVVVVREGGEEASEARLQPNGVKLPTHASQGPPQWAAPA